jgi:hypothetical protein
MTIGIPRPLAHHPHTGASGLASLGRGGDSMLVHMSPAEVGGLQKLAMAHGGSLTINPQTGLPEAFSLSSLLPMIAGAVVGDFGGPDLTSILPELSVGAGLIEKASGGSWTDALTKGLQFYGGAAGAQSLNAMSGPAITQAQMDAAANQTPVATTTTTAATDINNVAPSVEDSYTPPAVVTPNITLPEISKSGITTGLETIDPNTNQVVSTVQGQPTSALQQFENNPSSAAKQFFTGLSSSPLGQKLALAGIASGVSSAFQPSSSTSGTPQNVAGEYYVPAAGYSSLWNQGTLNPDFLKYGYLPPGEAMWIGQGMNPGTYTTTNPFAPGGAYNAPTSQTTQPGVTGKATVSPSLKMKEGGIASLKRFDAGGVTAPMSPEQQAMISQQALQNSAMQNQPPPMQNNTISRAFQADPMAAMNFMQELNGVGAESNVPPSADAMNQYLANLTGAGNSATGTGNVTGQAGYTVAPLTTTPTSTAGDSTATNTAGSITGTPTTSTPTSAGNTAGSAESGTSYGGNVYGSQGAGTAGSAAQGMGDTGSGSSGISGLQGSLSGVVPSALATGAQDVASWASSNPLLSAVAGIAIPPVGLGILGAKGLNYLANSGTPATTSPTNSTNQTANSNQTQATDSALATLQQQASDAAAAGESGGGGGGNYGTTTGPAIYDSKTGQYLNGLNQNSLNQIAGNAIDTMTSNYDISPTDYAGYGNDLSMTGNANTGDNPFGQNPNGRNVYNPATGQWNTAKQLSGSGTGMAAGGLAQGGLGALPEATYAAGGKLLRGPGDGMSDSIPAVIHGSKPQRAALADGEFVIPADVVSHLGNGSTEAGSRKLYNMMDKIRRARTGRKQQAPAVKADRYLPA